MARHALQPDTGAVLLAAGAGRRMGYRPKSLLRRSGEPLLARQIRLLAEAGVAHVAVVLGHHAAQLEPLRVQAAALTGAPKLCWVTNPVPDDGPGGSLRLGLAALPEEVSTLLVLLADQPLLECEDIAAVLAAWRARAAGTQLVVPQHAGVPGHPIALGAALRAQVLASRGAAGLSAWRKAHPQQVQVLQLDHARCSTDVDTPEDLERLGRQWGVWLR